LDGRFATEWSLTTMGRASLYGMVVLAVVVAVAAFAWSSVDFAMAANTGEGCLSGMLTVLGLPTVILGFVYVFTAPENVKVVYNDTTVGDAVSEEGRAVRIGRAIGVIDGEDGVAERPLDDVMKADPTLNGRFTIRTPWSAVFLVIMTLGAIVPLGLGTAITVGAFISAEDPIHVSRQFECEYQAVAYLCDENSNLEDMWGYCENHTAVDGYWRCTDDFGDRDAWSQSANWSHLMDGTGPDGIDMQALRDEALSDGLLGFSPLGFIAVVIVLAALFSSAPLLLGLTPRRFLVDDEDGETHGRNAYTYLYATAIGSATALEHVHDASELETLAEGALAMGLGLTTRRSNLGKLLRMFR
tara:strand:- start:2916 stop:3986 length:1071 start_codon:yes stop_codon:yes gene_type:complete